MQAIFVQVVVQLLVVVTFCGLQAHSAVLTSRELSFGPNSGKISGKISKGSKTLIKDYPYAVHISASRGFGGMKCGGTIIRENIVVTAGHCLTNIPSTLTGSGWTFTVTAGESHRNGYESSSQRRTVKEIRRHPSFKETTLENDLALLILDQPFEFGKYVNALALPQYGQTFAAEAEACGWGSLNIYERGDTDDLRKTDLPLLDGTPCVTAYNSRFSDKKFVPEIMLCAGGDDRDTCQGDSGGPLICHSPDKSEQYLCGVTSWGLGCRGTPLPGVYARVVTYVKWIEDQIEKLGQPRCTTAQFQCVGNKKCIPLNLKCNSVDDCGDGSDEVGCAL